jgi:hypothetical protein
MCAWANVHFSDQGTTGNMAMFNIGIQYIREDSHHTIYKQQIINRLMRSYHDSSNQPLDGCLFFKTFLRCFLSASSSLSRSFLFLFPLASPNPSPWVIVTPLTALPAPRVIPLAPNLPAILFVLCWLSKLDLLAGVWLAGVVV